MATIKGCDMRRAVLMSVLIGFALPALAGDYQDSVEIDRKCRSAGAYAADHVLPQRQREPNIFLVKHELREQQLLDPKSKEGRSQLGRMTRAIWHDIYLADGINTRHDAYMVGWAICKDQTRR